MKSIGSGFRLLCTFNPYIRAETNFVFLSEHCASFLFPGLPLPSVRFLHFSRQRGVAYICRQLAET